MPKFSLNALSEFIITFDTPSLIIGFKEMEADISQADITEMLALAKRLDNKDAQFFLSSKINFNENFIVSLILNFLTDNKEHLIQPLIEQYRDTVSSLEAHSFAFNTGCSVATLIKELRKEEHKFRHEKKKIIKAIFKESNNAQKLAFYSAEIHISKRFPTIQEIRDTESILFGAIKGIYLDVGKTKDIDFNLHYENNPWATLSDFKEASFSSDDKCLFNLMIPTLISLYRKKVTEINGQDIAYVTTKLLTSPSDEHQLALLDIVSKLKNLHRKGNYLPEGGNKTIKITPAECILYALKPIVEKNYHINNEILSKLLKLIWRDNYCLKDNIQLFSLLFYNREARKILKSKMKSLSSSRIASLALKEINDFGSKCLEKKLGVIEFAKMSDRLSSSLIESHLEENTAEFDKEEFINNCERHILILEGHHSPSTAKVTKRYITSLKYSFLPCEKNDHIQNIIYFLDKSTTQTTARVNAEIVGIKTILNSTKLTMRKLVKIMDVFKGVNAGELLFECDQPHNKALLLEIISEQ